MRSLALALPLVLLAAPAVAANLRYAEDQAPASINPLFGSTMAEARINELVFDSLYADDAELATVPRLAESGELSPDRLQMTLRLREDVRWHDGAPFGADDVVFTIAAMKDPGTLSTEAGRVAFITRAERIDAHTVRLTFARPELRPEDKLQFKILPKHAFPGGPAVKRADPFRNRPIGTGPYAFAKLNDDNSVSLAANPDWRDSVGISQVTMREVSDKNYQAKLLMYESLEALVRVLPRDLAMLKANRKVELYPYQTNSWWYLGFNESRSQWADPQMRAALAALVDVDALLAPVGTGEVVTGPFVPSSPYYNHDVPRRANDPSEAARILQSKGYARGGSGWTKGGQPLSVTITAHQSLESAQEVAINLQSQLQSEGLQVSVQFLDDAEWKSRVWRERSFDLLLSQWTFDRNEDIREQFHSSGTRNFVNYKSPAVDALLDRARDAADPWARKAALREAHAAIAADTPMIFLWTLDNYAAISTRVRSAVIHPFYFFTFLPGWQMK
jgi:peptide/nickel transport system substrate-binding protein